MSNTNEAMDKVLNDWEIMWNAVWFANRGNKDAGKYQYRGNNKDIRHFYLYDNTGKKFLCGKLHRDVADKIPFERHGFTIVDGNISSLLPFMGVTDGQIELLNRQLRDIASDAEAQNNLPWLNESGDPKVILPYNGHTKLRIPLPLHRHLGLVSRASFATLYFKKDGETRVWVQRLTGQARVDTTAWGMLHSDHRYDQDVMRQAIGQQIRMNTPDQDPINITPPFLGQLMLTDFHHTDEHGPISTFDPLICNSFATEVASDFTPVPPPGSELKFAAVTPTEIIKMLEQGVFTPGSAVVLVHFLIVKGLGPRGLPDANLVKLCENDIAQQSYPA